MHANIDWVHCRCAWPRPQIWSCRDRSVINSMRGRSRRMIMMMMMFGRASFIGLIPRRWITIAAIQWQFLATCLLRALLETFLSDRTTVTFTLRLFTLWGIYQSWGDKAIWSVNISGSKLIFDWMSRVQRPSCFSQQYNYLYWSLSLQL